MGCCGQRRSQPPSAMPAASYPAWPLPVVQGLAGQVGSAFEGLGHGMYRGAAGHRSVVLRYYDRARVRVRGPVTGRVYEFSAEQPTQSVEARDAELLLRTRHFMRA